MITDLSVDFFAAIVSTAAFVLGIVNYIQTSRISDREYATLFSDQILNWATEVLVEAERVRSWLGAQDSAQRNAADIKTIHSSLKHLYQRGRLFISSEELDASEDEEDLHVLIRLVNQIASVASDAPYDPDSFAIYANSVTDYMEKFIAEIKKLLKASRRFKISTK